MINSDFDVAAFFKAIDDKIKLREKAKAAAIEKKKNRGKCWAVIVSPFNENQKRHERRGLTKTQATRLMERYNRFTKTDNCYITKMPGRK